MNIPQFRAYVKAQRQTETDPNKLLAYQDVSKWMFENGGGIQKTMHFLQHCINEQTRKARNIRKSNQAAAYEAMNMAQGYAHLRDVLTGVTPVQQSAPDDGLWSEV